MFKKLVDTNILYDAFTENDNTSKAVKIIDEPIYIFEGVLYELSNLLKNTVGSRFSVEIVEEILNDSNLFQILSCNLDEKKEALQIMYKYQTSKPKKDFSLCDSIQLVLTEKFNLTIYTTDERMSFYNQQKSKVIIPY